MASRLGQVLLLAAAIFAVGFIALSVADGAERWVGPAIIGTIVALIAFGVRYILVSSKA